MPHTPKDLSKCKECPPWCSPARWRIELARRANPDRYEFGGMTPKAAKVNAGSQPKLGGLNQ